jgi:hypothetical protein
MGRILKLKHRTLNIERSDSARRIKADCGRSQMRLPDYKSGEKAFTGI